METFRQLDDPKVFRRVLKDTIIYAGSAVVITLNGLYSYKELFYQSPVQSVRQVEKQCKGSGLEECLVKKAETICNLISNNRETDYTQTQITNYFQRALKHAGGTQAKIDIRTRQIECNLGIAQNYLNNENPDLSLMMADKVITKIKKAKRNAYGKKRNMLMSSAYAIMAQSRFNHPLTPHFPWLDTSWFLNRDAIGYNPNNIRAIAFQKYLLNER